MASFIDFDNPEVRTGFGLLALGQMPKSQGFAGLLDIANARDRAKQIDAQMQDRALQNQLRQNQLAAEQRKQSTINSLLGGITSDMGATTGGGIENLTPTQIALLKVNGVDIESPWKTSKEGFKREGGAYYEGATGGTKFFPKVGEGMIVQNGQVISAPGYAQANAMNRAAEAGAVAGAQAPYTIGIDTARQNLSAQLDPQKVYNPNSGREEFVPRSRVVGAQPQFSGAGYSGGSAAAAAPEQLMIIQSELDRLPANHPDRPALMRQIQRIGGGQAAPSNFAAGPSAAEAAANEVARVSAIEQAKADVKPTSQRANALADARQMLSVIDTLQTHPGRETATGLSSVLDPRNYIFGTDAKDFQVALKQLEGKTFLQAFESLKGGGAITEIEGKRATDAIARLSTAQSDKAFNQALAELKGIVNGSIDRQLGISNNTGPNPAKQVVKTGTYGGRKVIQYSDGSIEYAN